MLWNYISYVLPKNCSERQNMLKVARTAKSCPKHQMSNTFDRSWSKMLHCASYFQFSSKCLGMWSNTVFRRVWYITSKCLYSELLVFFLSSVGEFNSTRTLILLQRMYIFYAKAGYSYFFADLRLNISGTVLILILQNN